MKEKDREKVGKEKVGDRPAKLNEKRATESKGEIEIKNTGDIFFVE